MTGRLLRLAAGEAGGSPWKAWPLAAGLALGVGCLIFLLGLAGGIEQLLKERVAGSLPDRLRVSPSTMKLGPVQLEGGMGEEEVQACRALPGVTAVYRQAHFPGPVQLYASYGGQNLVTDLVLEGVDPGQVAEQVASGRTFTDQVADDQQVPAMIPQALLDIANAGISAHTSLPQLSPDALVGRHFQLIIGSSSFAHNPNPLRRECIAVGVSDQLGISGPAVPLELMRRWSKTPVRYHTLTLKLDRPERLAEVVSAVHRMGLSTPGVDTAERIAVVVDWARLAMGIFSLAVLLVAGIGVSSGLALQVREESRWIGLYRALGATRRDIMIIYLARAALLGLAGALVGVAGGWVVGLGVEKLVASQLPPGMLGPGGLFKSTVAANLGAVTFGLGVSLVSGFWPARQAARLKPAEALRGE